MEGHLSLTDDQFESQFRNGSLAPNLFNHEAHIRLAWIHVGRYGVEQACEHICCQIQAFDRQHGDGTKYHHTLSMAAVKAVGHFYQKSNANTFTDFINEFPRLISNFKSLVNTHYSAFVIRLPKARTQYLEPDLLPFS